jgi:hypothetical protein
MDASHEGRDCITINASNTGEIGRLEQREIALLRIIAGLQGPARMASRLDPA